MRRHPVAWATRRVGALGVTRAPRTGGGRQHEISGTEWTRPAAGSLLHGPSDEWLSAPSVLVAVAHERDELPVRRPRRNVDRPLTTIEIRQHRRLPAVDRHPPQV